MAVCIYPLAREGSTKMPCAALCRAAGAALVPFGWRRPCAACLVRVGWCRPCAGWLVLPLCGLAASGFQFQCRGTLVDSLGDRSYAVIRKALLGAGFRLPVPVGRLPELQIYLRRDT